MEERCGLVSVSPGVLSPLKNRQDPRRWPDEIRVGTLAVMDDAEFIDQLKAKLESTTGTPIELEIDRGDPKRLSVDFSGLFPKVSLGSDVLEYPGLARMFSQFAILSIRERREVSEMEFTAFLRRN